MLRITDNGIFDYWGNPLTHERKRLDMYSNMLEMLKALQSGETTAEKLISELQAAKSYVRRGATFYPLVFENFSEINGAPANVYSLGDGITRAGLPTEKRTRTKKSDAPKTASAKK